MAGMNTVTNSARTSASTTAQTAALAMRIATTSPGELSRADRGVALIHVQGAREDEGAIPEGDQDPDVAEARTDSGEDPGDVADQRGQQRIFGMTKHVGDRVEGIEAPDGPTGVGLDRAGDKEEEGQVRDEPDPEHEREPAAEEEEEG